MSALRLQFTIEAVDKATAKVRAVNSLIGRITAPARKLSASLRSLGTELGLPRIKSAADEVRSGWEKVNSAITSIRSTLLSTAAAGGALLFLIKRTAGLGNEAVNTAKRVGMTVEAVLGLGYAASQNGSNLGDMADGLKYLNRNAVAAAVGSQEAAIWFRRAGINVRDAHGKLKPTEQLLGDVADRFAKMPDGPRKTALAMGLLGRSGESLIPTLNLGRNGLEELKKRAEELGIVLDQKTARAFDELDNSMEDVGHAGKGIFIAALKPLLPLFTSIAQGVTKWLIANRALIASNITGFLQGLAEILPDIWAGVKFVGRGLGWLLGIVNRVVQFFGGWGVVVAALAGLLAGKLALALGALTIATVKFGIVLLTTPVGWFLAACAAIAAVVYLIYKNWGPIKDFFKGIWDGIVQWTSDAVDFITDLIHGLIRTVFWPFIKILELVNAVLPDSARQGTAVGRALNSGLAWVNGTPAPAAPGARNGAQVGGTIKIEIDANGRPRVRGLKSDNRDVDLEVYSGGVLEMG